MLLGVQVSSLLACDLIGPRSDLASLFQLMFNNSLILDPITAKRTLREERKALIPPPRRTRPHSHMRHRPPRPARLPHPRRATKRCACHNQTHTTTHHDSTTPRSTLPR